jgi:DNA-binding transcriptional LysR family regulator
MTDLLDCPPALLDTTLDQLRTLLVVRETGSALRAARALGREQSSVQKQIDTLNRNFQVLCGEMLVSKQGRGKDFLFTSTGEAVIEVARGTLDRWLGEIHTSRRRLGRTITVGTTEFMLDLLAQARERLIDDFARRGVEFRIVHVRTKDFWPRLESNEVDLMCGTVVAGADDDLGRGTYDVIEWRRGGPILVTNLPTADLPGDAIGVGRLSDLPMIVPAAGLVADFLNHWYGPDFRYRMRVAAVIDDLHYGLALMRNRLIQGCMIVTNSIGQQIMKGKLPGGGDLRVIELETDLQPKLEIVSAIFARKGRRARYEPDHPLNLLWEALRAEVAANRTPAEA